MYAKNRNDRYYLEKMFEYINIIEQYSQNMKDNDIRMTPNNQLADGIIYKFIQLREEAKNISSELLNANPELEKNIRLLSGFRNRLTHDYENVEYSFFDEVFLNDLPSLKAEIEKCLNSI